MNDIKDHTYYDIIIIKIEDLISLIIENNNLNFDDALDYLYNSILYENLINEETKLWHLSTKKLFEIIELEKKTNEFIYPDFV